MSTTQRSDGKNEQHSEDEDKSQFTLLEFVGNFENVLKAIREKENLLDHQDHMGHLPLLTILGIEKSLSRVYTSQVFVEFQTEQHVV